MSITINAYKEVVDGQITFRRNAGRDSTILLPRRVFRRLELSPGDRIIVTNTRKNNNSLATPYTFKHKWTCLTLGGAGRGVREVLVLRGNCLVDEETEYSTVTYQELVEGQPSIKVENSTVTFTATSQGWVSE